MHDHAYTLTGYVSLRNIAQSSSTKTPSAAAASVSFRESQAREPDIRRTPLNLDDNQNRRGRRSSGAAGGWDLKEEYGGNPGEGKGGEGMGARRDRDMQRRPKMGRQKLGVPGRFCGNSLASNTYPAADFQFSTITPECPIFLLLHRDSAVSDQ